MVIVQKLVGQLARSSMIAPTNEDSVVIVGAGIIGIACAHYLVKAGYQVTVVEKGKVANACSQGNCGYICPSHVLPLTEPGAFKIAVKSLFNPKAPFRVKPSVSVRQWKWFWEFAKRCNKAQMLRAGKHLKAILDSSMAEYRQLVPTESIDCEWRDVGLLYVLLTKHGMQDFAETDELLTEHFKVPAKRIDGKDLPDLDPALKSNLAGAYLYEGDASIRPDLLNEAWTERLRQQGVRFIEDCELHSVHRQSGRVDAIQTSQGVFQANHFVFAIGAWSPKLAAMLDCYFPIQPGKGYSVTMSRPEPCPRYPMLFPEHKVGVSPFENGYRLGSMMEFVGYDTSIPQSRIDQLRTSAEPYLVAPHTDTEQARWYGWRPMTWDSLPIIGKIPKIDNAFAATGHNMLGLSLAPATGRMISEFVQGQPPHIDASGFCPTRFG